MNITTKELSKIFIEVLKLEYQDMSAEILPTNSLEISITIDYKFILKVFRPLDKVDDLEKNHVIFKIYINDELLFGGIAHIKDFVNRINKIIGYIKIPETLLDPNIIDKDIYSKLKNPDTIYKCVNPDCKWQGKDEQKSKEKIKEYVSQLVCPKCGNNYFSLIESN